MRVLTASMLLLMAPTAAWAGDAPKPGASEGSSAETKEKFSLVHVDALANMMADGKVQIFDANGPEFRTANGVIPGAKMLGSFQFDPATTLPADKGTPLVFYCANSH